MSSPRSPQAPTDAKPPPPTGGGDGIGCAPGNSSPSRYTSGPEDCAGCLQATSQSESSVRSQQMQSLYAVAITSGCGGRSHALCVTTRSLTKAVELKACF